MKLDKRTTYRIAGAAGALLLFLLFYVDDWSRDFTSYEATVTGAEAVDYLKPLLVTNRSVPEVLEAARMAASRIRNWEYVGDSSIGDESVLLFVRTNRILRIKDDISIHVTRTGAQWTFRAESHSRLAIGDLGRNPRNLRRFLEEIHAVGTGAARRPVFAAGAPTFTR